MEGRNDITLEINGTPIRCRRADLIEHSDYFKAMFEGNFAESSKTVIPLNGVELEAMNIILKLLWNREQIIDEDDILSVLETACMLQFIEIKNRCIEQVINMLSVNNCLKIWFYTEPLDVTTLSRKAKLMALLTFKLVKDTSHFLELNLNEIVNYLGNVGLQCLNELVVFEALNSWYHNLDEKSMEILLKLLHCLDFNAMRVEEIEEITTCRNITEHQTLIDTLNCVVAIKKGISDVENNFEKVAVDYARALLRSRSRNPNDCPCILLQKVPQQDAPLGKSFVYYDPKHLSLKKLCDLPREYENLYDIGFKGSKRYLVLYENDVDVCDDWNEFRIYDLIKGTWKKMERLPYGTRAITETCICDKYIYILTETDYAIDINVLCYDLEEDEWCCEDDLPCSGRQIKCCCFEDKLFVLNINNKCGYIFNPQKRSWNTLTIYDKENVLTFDSKIISLCSYKSSLYIKGKTDLFVLKAQDNTLLVVNKIVLFDTSAQNYVYQMESVMCNNVLYSLQENFMEPDKITTSLESFNMYTYEGTKIFEVSNNEVFEINNELFQFGWWPLYIGSVFYHGFDTNDLVNSC